MPEVLIKGWDAVNEEWIKIQVDENGYLLIDLDAINLDDLGDVNAPAPADGDALVWDDVEEEWVAQAIGAAVGGLYGINVEVLAADKTLTPDTDKIYQYLDEGGANRIITLATVGAEAGDRFVIRHNGTYSDAHYLTVKQAAITLDRIYSGVIKEFIFDGTNWVSRGIGSGENDNKKYNIGIGYYADPHTYGVAIGYNTHGYSYGVAVGNNAAAMSNGVAVGYNSYGRFYGVAIGYQASVGTVRRAIALGMYSKCVRYGELSINIDHNESQKFNNLLGGWSETTTNDTPTELFCAGYSNRRWYIRNNSALAFKLIVTARDNVSGHVAMYTVEDGLVKKAGDLTAALVSCTVTTVYEDDAAWDVAVAIDGDGENLIITVTGDDTNPTQWAARLEGVETHF